MLAHHKGALTLALVLSVAGAVLSLMQPLLINNIISRIGEVSVTPLVWGLVGLLIVSSVVSALQLYVMTRTAESAVLTTRRQLAARMLRLPVRVYDRHRSGDLVTRMVAEADAAIDRLVAVRV